MLPDGTWFQSAIAERNTTMTTMNNMNPRHSRQMRAEFSRRPSVLMTCHGKYRFGVV